jgi:hypothetical protein
MLLSGHYHAGVEGLVVFVQGLVLIFFTLLFVLKIENPQFYFENPNPLLSP